MRFGTVLLLQFAFSLALWYLMRMHVKRRTRAENLLNSVHREVQEIIAEINGAADQNITLLEDRIGAVAKQLQAANATIVRLEQAISEAAEVRPVRRIEPTEFEDSEEAFVLELQRDIPEDESSQSHVIRLHKSGLSAELIAAKCGLAIGEVELMLSLYGERNSR